MELTHLKAFLTVARKGNISAAAKELHATQPNLGRQMTALSKEVGIELFIRHSRGIELTEQGKEFLELCQNIVGQLEQGTTLIKEKNAEAKGLLKFITGSGTLERVLKNIPAFTEKFPQLNIQFNSIVNVLQCQQFQTGDVDVGLIPVTFNDSDLVQHHLFDMLLRVYGSPSYLKSHPIPKTFKNLREHKLIVYSGDNQEVFNKNVVDDETNSFYTLPFYTVNSGLSMRAALISGLGIGCYAYDQNLIEKNRLVDVFPDMPDQKIPYYYTYHKRLEGSPKVEAFHEFLKEVVKVWQRPGKKM
jgi:DNA-binding transcriptional LysR family regulator